MLCTRTTRRYRGGAPHAEPERRGCRLWPPRRSAVGATRNTAYLDRTMLRFLKRPESEMAAGGGGSRGVPSYDYM